jgi:stearoyl-CoA desaturase (delta-9 desaturase)
MPVEPSQDLPYVAPAPAPLATRLVTLGAVLVPFAGLAAAIVLLWNTPFHWVYLTLLVSMYVVTMLGIGVGFHRLFTHKSFEVGPVLTFIWGVLGSMAVEGSLIRWVATHRMHHQHADQPGDPHSPHVHKGEGVAGLLRGMWHAHIGWLFEKDAPGLERYVPDLLKNRVIVGVSRTFTLWVIVGLLIPAVLGGVITWTWTGMLLGFLWGGLIRVLLVHHVTWSINSVCHIWGSRPYSTRDESRDNPVLGVLALGEGWHNTHHAFPTSARHGLAWWKLDINYIVIRVMQLLRLARNVRVPAAERLLARRRTLVPVSVATEAPRSPRATNAEE